MSAGCQTFTFRMPAPDEHAIYGRDAFQGNIGKTLTVDRFGTPMVGTLVAARVGDGGKYVDLTIQLEGD